MAGSVNKEILIGNLGRDPEVRQLSLRGKGLQPQPRDQRALEGPQHGASARSDRSGIGVDDLFPNRWCAIARTNTSRKGSKVYLEGPARDSQVQDQSVRTRYTTESPCARTAVN